MRQQLLLLPLLLITVMDVSTYNDGCPCDGHAGGTGDDDGDVGERDDVVLMLLVIIFMLTVMVAMVVVILMMLLFMMMMIMMARHCDVDDDQGPNTKEDASDSYHHCNS